MNPERWERIKEVAFSAMEREGDSRARFLEEACGTDSGLRLAVEELLEEHQRPGDTLARAIGSLAAGMPRPGGQANPSLIGRTISHYKITGKLGEGGMGVVYRATDIKLGREVAIKVLPWNFTADSGSLARFDREARMLAALNHPNIAAIHGLEESDGIHYLVLELVPGPTLAERLRSKPLALEEAITVCRQIADGMEAAHEKGIIHRDLKPSNIKITPEGKAKVLDFGLAKPTEASPSDSPEPGTASQPGAIWGTTGYMSPEQGRGGTVDKRADIWAFGCVLYEALSGQRAFPGETLSDYLVAVQTREPDWAALLPDAPQKVRSLLRRCLQKDAQRRLRDIGDARLELEEALSGTDPEVPPASLRSRSRRQSIFRTAVVILGLSVVAVMAAASGWFHVKTESPGTTRFWLALPEGMRIAGPRYHAQIAISADGRKLAFAAVDVDGTRSLWVRSLDSLSMQRLDNTEGADFPFWSPDGQFIGFFAEGKLKKVAISGGQVQSVCDVRGGTAGTWNQDGIIVFAILRNVGVNAVNGPLYRVSAGGGPVAVITTLDHEGGEVAHFWPQFLPDGKHILYLARNRDPEQNGIYVQQLGSQERRLLLKNPMRAWYAPPGYLLFIRGGVVMAQAMDPEYFQLQGDAVSVAEQVADNPALGGAAFAASQNGVLVYRARGQLNSRLVWYDREGRRLQTVGPPGTYDEIHLSPDEKRVAVAVPPSGYTHAWPGFDYWLLELTSGIFSRLALGVYDPRWSPDGRRIAVVANQGGKGEIREVDVASGAQSVLYSDRDAKFLDDWSPDSRFLLYRSGSTAMLLPVVGARMPQVLIETAFSETAFSGEFRFSPAGRWVAYHSNEPGRFEVFVAATPSFTQKRQVSMGGGHQPLWRKDGKELFYLSREKKLMAVDIQAGPMLETGIPRELFQTAIPVDRFIEMDYAVTQDGKRFLIREPASSTLEHQQQVGVVLNWDANLRQ